MRHIPVLLDETIAALRLKKGNHIIDCTLGDGGHTEAILSALQGDARILAIDVDPESLFRAKQFLYQYEQSITFVRTNFEYLSGIVETYQFHPVHGILMDFGWSSPQFSERERGFSFQKNEPLDMRYSAGLDSKQTAKDIVNTWSEQELIRILTDYADESFAKPIAAHIVRTRQEQLFETTDQLVACIIEAVKQTLKSTKDIPWVGGLHPATKTFQALRMAVNDELGVIERVLPQALDVVDKGGRIVVITFHSIEDRIVKHFFKKHQDILNIITKKPIIAGEKEWQQNPRARSAKLRVVEKK